MSDSGYVENAALEDVRAFHQKFGLLNFPTPGRLAYGKLRERIECMLEEITEFAAAAGFEVETSITPGGAVNDLAD